MLWEKADITTKQTLESGKLLPIVAVSDTVEQNGIQYFNCFSSENLKKKKALKKTNTDPFITYDQDMFIENIDDDYICLLNKFPIITPHLLICSKEYIFQAKPLKLADFKAWIQGITEPNVLGFFNSGPVAGSSQTHRHMQLVRTEIPLEEKILEGNLPFKHRIFLFSELNPEQLYQDYLTTLKELELFDFSIKDSEQTCKPYNILLTQRWMFIIPREKNQIGDIFAHGINYSGRFLTSDKSELKWLQEYGFLKFLTDCGYKK